jgi:hypothetical protein
MKKMMWCVAALLALSGCGGGGNESGPVDSIEVSMSNVTVTKGDGGCYVGNGPLVHVFGGTPPYRVSNPLPSGLAFSRNVVPASGDAFQINFVGGVCMTSMVVTVEDDMGRLARVTVNNGSAGS